MLFCHARRTDGRWTHVALPGWPDMSVILRRHAWAAMRRALALLDRVTERALSSAAS